MTGNADHSAFRIPHSAFDIRHSTFAIFDSPFDVSGNAGRAIVFVDSDADFYPPAAWERGIPCDRLVVIRPRNEREAYEAADEALRCSAVAAVIVSLRGLNDRLARRLQLAAESSGGLGVLLRPVRRPTHRFAAVQMRLEGVPPSGDRPHARLCRITLLTVREGTPAEPFLVDLDHETGAGVVSALPGHAAAARTG